MVGVREQFLHTTARADGIAVIERQRRRWTQNISRDLIQGWIYYDPGQDKTTQRWRSLLQMSVHTRFATVEVYKLEQTSGVLPHGCFQQLKFRARLNSFDHYAAVLHQSITSSLKCALRQQWGTQLEKMGGAMTCISREYWR